MGPEAKRVVQRDFFREAIDISNGKPIPIERDHIMALASAYVNLFSQARELREVMAKALLEAREARRAARGY